jgi:predicted N-formylglutamate amidohydrolase
MPRVEKKKTARKKITNPEPALVFSCEHGGNTVPAAYRSYFKGAKKVLASHRGWDPGALDLARTLARSLDAPLVATTISRLLIECNRSLSSRNLFSEYTRRLSDEEKRDLLKKYYIPHRGSVAAVVRSAMRTHGAVVHAGVHTFTPVMKGRMRNADVGLLYDPRRPAEAVFCELWTIALARIAPELHVRRNYPYRGWSDGLTTALRASLPPTRYLGIELEVNQALVAMSAAWARTRSAIAESLALVLGG